MELKGALCCGSLRSSLAQGKKTNVAVPQSMIMNVDRLRSAQEAARDRVGRACASIHPPVLEDRINKRLKGFDFLLSFVRKVDEQLPRPDQLPLSSEKLIA